MHILAMGSIQAMAGFCNPVSLVALSILIYGSHGFDFGNLSKLVTNSSPKAKSPHFTSGTR
jgi:hypothetical protein